MLFQVRMDVHLPVDMPAEQANQLKRLRKLIRKIYSVKVSGVIFGGLQDSIQTSVFLMSKATKSYTTFYRACPCTPTWTLK
jgi:hypothetical protein